MSTLWFLNTLIGRRVIVERPENSSKASIPFFSLYCTDIKGKRFDFSALKGKKTIIVNTACECGFTKQFYELENFYRNFRDQINIIAFPCNDFGNQDPGTSDEISNFCKGKFDISFPIMSKIKIKGREKDQVYSWLTSKKMNGWNDIAPHWNFCKYLVDEHGELQLFTNPVVKPSDEKFLTKILLNN